MARSIYCYETKELFNSYAKAAKLYETDVKQIRRELFGDI